MAIPSLATSNARPTLFEHGGAAFMFDASISEGHSVQAEWTKEPIEGGSQLSDHRVIRQRRLPMTVVVSSAELGGLIRGRHIEAWTRLVALATADPPALFDVTTATETLENVVIESAGYPVTPTTGNAMVAPIVLVQLTFPITDIAQNLADAAQDDGLGEVDLGSQGLG